MSNDRDNAEAQRESMAKFLDRGDAAVETVCRDLTVWITGVDGELVGWDQHKHTANPFRMGYQEFDELTEGEFMLVDVEETPLSEVDDVR